MKTSAILVRQYKALYQITLVLIILVIGLSNVNAQKKSILFERLYQEDSNFVESFVLLPKDIRTSALIASGTPEIIVQTDKLTANTRKEFQNLISPYDRETQENLWSVARYPELMNEMTHEGKPSRRELNDILKNYPDDVQDAARSVGTWHFESLYEMNLITVGFQKEFDKILLTHPPETQNAYRTLIKQSEALDLLSKNIRSAVLLGEAYAKDPVEIEKEIAELSEKVSIKRAKEYDSWKNNLENDDQARSEYEAAAKEYAVEQGYDEMDYRAPVNTTTIIVYDHYYPYWFGYPSWYAYPYWYPYPWWYDWGYYYGPYGEIIYIGFPSRHFMYWYFYYYPHHYYYPYFTNHCVGHYYHHVHSYSSVSVAVVDWKNDNKHILKEEWLKEEHMRVDRIREFGEIEQERITYNNLHPEKPISREEYYSLNSRKYPELNEYREDIKPVTTKGREYEPVKREEEIRKENERVEPRERPKEEPIYKERKTEPVRKNPVPQHKEPVPQRKEPVPVPKPPREKPPVVVPKPQPKPPVTTPSKPPTKIPPQKVPPQKPVKKGGNE